MLNEHFSDGRWNHWKKVHFQNARGAVKETWCPFPILAVKEQQFTTRHGYALILIADTISKSGMVRYTWMSLSSAGNFALAPAES